MAGFGRRCRLPSLGPTLLLALATGIVALFSTGDAIATRLMFRSYGQAEGLTNFSGRCVAQIGGGYLLVCSDHGVFSYDGRRFTNLGPAQGLADGGVVEEIRLAADGRVAVRYPDQILVSTQPATLDRPPTSLSFRSVDLRGIDMYERLPNQMAAIDGGLALVANRRTMKVALPPTGPPILLTAPLEGADTDALVGPTALFAVGGVLWETFDDGRVCAIDRAHATCYGRAQGLVHGPYVDVVAGTAGTVVARSSRFMATIDPRSRTASEEALPEQDGQYQNYRSLLGLFRTPRGELLTQSARGLIVREPSGWRQLLTSDGLPAGLIATVLADADGQLWIQAYGGGLYRGLGFGHWEGLQAADGLSKGSAWQIVGSERSALWVATDSGVDEVRRQAGEPEVVKIFHGPAFAAAVGPDGRIWSDVAGDGALAIDPLTGTADHVPMPEISRIAADSDRVWFATRAGLYHVDRQAGRSSPLVADHSFCRRTTGLASDGNQGVWLLCDGKLWHRHADGTTVRVGGLWPSREFFPLDLTPTRAGHFWLAGAGGLYDISVAADRIVSLLAVPASDLQTDEVVAVMVDHRGWVWAGTDRGVSVFDGRRWVSADSSLGLVWDDLSESGIHEDPDGSIWMGTDFGLSHLLDPPSLFEPRPMRIAISQALLGGKTLATGRHAYDTSPLLLLFGTLNYATESSIVFRYNLSDVDRGWAESASGTTRYPSVPPGRHVLTVVGYDPLTHVTSAPVTMTIDMAYPWWRSTWAETLYAALVALCLTLFVKIRDRVANRRQREGQRRLEALVKERTSDMHVAQAELRRQATLDGLTGLLTRRELQSRLAERLALPVKAGELLVAMIDIDHFKRINDGHGHLAGDDVLGEIGARLSAHLREGDYAGRYGGEEMLMVLNDHDGRSAERIQLLHQSIRDASVRAGPASIRVTCSIGLAWAVPDDDWSSLVGRADAGLYHAKNSGRDRIVQGGGQVRMDWAGVPTGAL